MKLFKITSFKLAILLTLLFTSFYILANDKFALLKIVELKILDSRFQIRGPRSPSDEVVIVAIDDYSIENLGMWPWPRSYHAEIIDILTEDQAKVIGFDLVLTEAEENYERDKLRELRQYYKSLALSQDTAEGIEFGEKLDHIVSEATNDQKFAESMKRNNNAAIALVFVVNEKKESSINKSMAVCEEDLGYDEDASPEDVPPFNLLDERSAIGDEKSVLDEDEPPFDLFDEESAPDENAVMVSRNIFVPEEIKKASLKNIYNLDNKERYPITVADNIFLPITEFYSNAKILGHINFFPDIDGNLRWETMVIELLGNYYPAMGIVLLKEYYDLDNNDIQLILGKGIQLGDTYIPLDKKGRILINYYGPERTFTYYSFADIIQRNLPAGTFKDKIVLIGGSATGLGDIWPTPFSQSMAGIEKHATVISNILQEDFLYRNRNTFLCDIALILVIGLVLGLLLPKLSPIKGSLCGFFIFILVIGVTYSFFFFFHIWINLVYPVLNAMVISTVVITYKFFTEEKEKRVIKGAFKQYLNPTLVEELAENPDSLRLGGGKKELTVLFSDIRGFTTISEGLTPEQLVHIINTYLSAMTKIILRNNGLVDKFIGDAIMAIFGAPFPFEQHPQMACATALSMIEELKRVKPMWHEEGFPDINIGVGINTGPMVIGNMGSEERFDYTVLGDSVNLASRLEGLCKQYGTNIIVSEFTAKKIEGFILRELDMVKVKGKEQAIKIYDIMGLESEKTKKQEVELAEYQEALDLYRQRQFSPALESFKNLADLTRAFLYKVYAERCATFLESPPPENWDGVCKLTRK
ncbi:MAG: CHASE2 domain-containing protein [bacterium]